MDEFFYDIVIETTMTIMEIIQERGVNITVNRLMDNDMVLFAFYRTLPNGTNLFLQCQVRLQLNLSMDLHKLFINFFQVLTCIGQPSE